MSKHKLYLSDIITGMDAKQDKAADKPTRPSRKVMVGAVVAMIVLLFGLLVNQLATPKRSVAEYCKVYKREKARLAKLPGDAYPSGVFDDSLSDANEFAVSFDNLQKSAPSDIRSDVKSLQDAYRKIADEPSQAISASLGGVSAENSVKQWTIAHCR